MSAVLVEFADGSGYGVDGREKTFLPGPLYLTRNDKKYVAAYLSNAKDFGHRDSPQLRRAAYREDLKFLRKYGLKRMAKTAVHSDLNEKAIIREIQRVIQDIDDHAKRRQSGNDGGGGVDDEHKSNDDNDGGTNRSSSRRRRGSTKMIQEEDDLEMKDIMDAQDMTPPLSEVEEEDEDEVIAIGGVDGTKQGTESNSKPTMTRKRTFADLQEHGTRDAVDDDDYNAKRMKSNLGDAVPVIKKPLILRRQLTEQLAASDGVTE